MDVDGRAVSPDCEASPRPLDVKDGPGAGGDGEVRLSAGILATRTTVASSDKMVEWPALVGPPVKATDSCVGGGGAALETLGKVKAIPTIAMVRISFSFMVAALDPSPWRLAYYSGRAGSREWTFSSDIAYSDSPAALRQLVRSYAG